MALNRFRNKNTGYQLTVDADSDTSKRLNESDVWVQLAPTPSVDIPVPTKKSTIAELVTYLVSEGHAEEDLDGLKKRELLELVD